MEPPEFSDIPPGYPQHSALSARDTSYAIFRKSRSLNARSLFYYQCELLDLERQLFEVDSALNCDRSGSAGDTLKSFVGFKEDPDRLNLLATIRCKLSAYSVALLQYDQVLNLSTPSHEHVGLLQKWIETSQPFVDANNHYLADTETRGSWKRERFKFSREPRELATLQRSHDSTLAQYLRKSPFALFYLEDIIEFGQGNKKQKIWFYPSSRISWVVGVISVLLAVALTCMGMIILHLETRTTARLGLIGLFTGLVATLLGICGAKKSEIMIGTIGYAAVLVVFISANS